MNKKNGGSNDGHPHGGGPQIEFETSKDTNSSCSYLSPLERGQKKYMWKNTVCFNLLVSVKQLYFKSASFRNAWVFAPSLGMFLKALR